MKKCPKPKLIKTLLVAVGLLFWGLATVPPAAAFDRPEHRTQIAENGTLVQFFEQNRRRNRKKRRNDLIPLRNNPDEQRAPVRELRRQDRNRRNSQRRDQDDASKAVRRGDILPLDGIIRSAQRYCPGKFLGAKLQRGGKGYSYQVRILRPSGRRIGLTIDAQSGAVVGGRCR
jgi:hypothetical protein